MQTNDKITVTAIQLIMAFDRFGSELIGKIEDEEITNERQIMEFAQDFVVENYGKQTEISQ